MFPEPFSAKDTAVNKTHTESDLYEIFMFIEEYRFFLSKTYGITSGYKWYGEKHSKE